MSAGNSDEASKSGRLRIGIDGRLRIGIDGRLASEWVADLNRNQWPTCVGICSHCGVRRGHTVRQASVKALDSLWRAREHERLVDLILEEGNLLRRRRLLDIAIETGNPGLFATQNWVSKLADGFEPIHRIRMKRILKDRRKELKSDLEKRKR